MIRFVFLVSLFINSALALSSSPSEEIDPLYGLGQSFVSAWQDIDARSANDPSAMLTFAQQELDKLPETQVQQRVHAKIVIFNILLKLENAKEVLIEADTITSDVMSLNNRLYQGLLFSAQAEALKGIGQYDSALEKVTAAIQIFSQHSAKSYKASSHTLKGQILSAKGKTKLALEEYLLAYDIFKSTEESLRIGAVVSSIGGIYDQTGEHQKAVDYYKESLEYLNRETQAFYLSIVYYNIGDASMRAENLSEAEHYLQKALAISEEIEDQVGVAYVNSRMAKLAKKQANYQLSISYAADALRTFIQVNDLRMNMNSRVTLAQSYIELSDFDNANLHIEQAVEISEELGNYENLVVNYEVAAEIYQAQGNFERALWFYQKFAGSQKTQFESRQQAKLDELKVKFDSEQQRAENLLLQQENTIYEANIKQQALQQKLLWLMLALAFVVVAAIAYALLRQVNIRKRFTRLALTDELTGAPNRRHIMQYAERCFRDALAMKQSLVVAILDLDHFKSINDTYGHDVGDKVLVNFFSTVKDCLQDAGRIGRLGGEEWLLVLPKGTIANIEHLFQKINTKSQENVIKELMDEQVVTFSMGVAQLNGQTSDLTQLLKAADDGVYRAKDLGRNQWFLANEQ